jgi:hypothetical protein
MDAYPRLMWINGRLDEQRIAAAREHDALSARRRATAARHAAAGEAPRRGFFATLFRRSGSATPA